MTKHFAYFNIFFVFLGCHVIVVPTTQLSKSSKKNYSKNIIFKDELVAIYISVIQTSFFNQSILLPIPVFQFQLKTFNFSPFCLIQQLRVYQNQLIPFPIYSISTFVDQYLWYTLTSINIIFQFIFMRTGIFKFCLKYVFYFVGMIIFYKNIYYFLVFVINYS